MKLNGLYKGMLAMVGIMMVLFVSATALSYTNGNGKEPIEPANEVSGEFSFGFEPVNTIVQTEVDPDFPCYVEDSNTIVCEQVQLSQADRFFKRLNIFDQIYFNLFGIPVRNFEGTPIKTHNIVWYGDSVIEVDISKPGGFRIGWNSNEFVVTNMLWTEGVFNYTNPIAGNISINATFTSGEYFSELMSSGTTSQQILNVSFTSTEPAGAKIGVALRTFNESFPTAGTIFANLTAYWKFDSSNVTDYSDNDNTGTIVGPINPVADGKEGYGGSYDFPDTAGEGSYISVPANDNFSSMTDFFTLAAWVYPTSTKQHNVIVTKGNGNDNDFWWGIDDGVRIVMYPADGTSPKCLSATEVTQNAWNFVTTTYNESGFQHYVNGQLSGPISCTHDVQSNGYDVWIGESDFWDVYDNDFVGMIDEVAIWNRSLEEAEIATLFEAGLNNWSAWSVEYYENSSVTVDQGNITQFRANLTQVDDANACHLLKIIVGYGVAAAPPVDDQCWGREGTMIFVPDGCRYFTDVEDFP